MSVLDQVKTVVSSFITPTPTIGNAHNVVSTTNVIFTENNEQIQKTRIYPGAGFSYYSPDNKYTNAQATAYNHEYDVRHEESGDMTAIGSVGWNFKENGTGRFASEMNNTIQNMLLARQEYDNQKGNQYDLEKQFPNLTFSPSQYGLLYTDPVSGKTGQASELV